MTKSTQHDRIIDLMVKGDGKRWWRASDFAHPSIVGYEAGARFAELRHYTELFETRDVGKFKERRIRWENMKVWWESTPQGFRAIFKKYDKAPKRTYEMVGGVMRESVIGSIDYGFPTEQQRLL